MDRMPCLILGMVLGSLDAQGGIPSLCPAEQYLVALAGIVKTARQQIPQMTASAEKAASLIIGGGTLWVGGRQRDFAIEAYARAGGLMGLKVLDENAVKKNDVILYAVPETLQSDDIKKIQNWSKQGVYVLAFACRENELGSNIILGGVKPSAGLAISDQSTQKLCPADTVSNVIYLWAWTGEFVSACTRQGKMPVLYLSYGLPGGYDRAKKYQGKVFHDDLKISPVKAGVLATKYLDVIEEGLKALRSNELSKIRMAAQWWREVSTVQAFGITMGHMYPPNFQDVRAPQPISLQAGDQKQTVQNPSEKTKFVLFAGYQYPPQKLADQAIECGFRLVYMTVQPTQPAEVKDKILYINPHWPLTDACVAIPGYDVNILPASGVLDAAVYWAMVAQRYVK